MENTLAKRLVMRRQQAGLSQTDLAARAGVTPQAVQQWEAGKTMPRGKRMSALASALGCSPEWLLFGAELVTEQANASDQATVSPGPHTSGLLPLISWIQAGTWMEAEENYVTPETEFLPCPVSHSCRSYALRVIGDSMTSPVGRSYPEGMVIYVDPEKPASVGDRVVARLVKNGRPDGVTFKQLASDGDRCYLKPLNPHHPPIFDEFQIIGKVIGGFVYD